MELILAFGAGLLTLINPCVLPILPIVLATAMQASRWGPVALAGGMSVMFVTLGVAVSAFGRSVGLTEDTVGQAAAVLMIGFGLVLLVPQFNARFATATAGFAGSADAKLDVIDQSGVSGQFFGGMLLGAVWSPCVGPTLGAAIGLASQGEDLVRAGAIMAAFALGASSIILALGYGARSFFLRHRSTLQAISTRGRPVLGAVFVATGIALLFNVHHMVEGWALDHMPIWLQNLSVSI